MTEQKKIQGVVSVVAITGGIKFQGNDKWFNSRGEIKHSIIPQLKGSKIAITMLNGSDTDFNAFEVLEKPKEEATDYNTRREQREITREKKLSNGAALNSAIEILKISEDRPEHSKDILEMAVKLSKDIKKVIEE